MGKYLLSEDEYTEYKNMKSRVKELEQKINAQFAEMEEKLTYEENKNFELKENIKTIFTSLIIANHVDIGAIQDTIWVDKYTTLWNYIRIILNMNDKQFDEFEKQALNFDKYNKNNIEKVRKYFICYGEVTDGVITKYHSQLLHSQKSMFELIDEYISLGRMVINIIELKN